MQNITAKTGEAHVTSDQFRSIIESIVGDGSYIADLDEQLEPELSTDNTLKIRSGVLIHHGHVMRVPPGTYDTVTYTNGSQGKKRIDLVVARYTKNSGDKTEPTDWVIIQGTPADSNPAVPAYTAGNMQQGDLTDDCPVFELHFDGINVTEVKKLVSVTRNIDDLKASLEEAQKEVTSIRKKVGSKDQEGYFPVYNDPNHNVGMTFGKLGEKVYVRAVIDGAFYDLMPNNWESKDNYKIIDVVPVIIDSSWKLKLSIWIDQTVYTKYVSLE